MTSKHPFQQVDVFSSDPLKGNPLAVVCDADGLSDAQMAAFANWTNLSETTFLLKPTSSDADYRVRIFTPYEELPFAGHPTLGTCHVWLSRQSEADKTEVVQECEAGLVRIRVSGGKLAFAAPPLRKSGPVDADTLEKAITGLGLPKDAVIDANWTDNGPGWVSLLLRSRQDILNIKPNYSVLGGLKVGAAARCGADDAVETDFELRAFADGYEDPVTGSLNAGMAQWLIGAGIAQQGYIASQGTVLGRAGRVSVDKIGDDIWIGGAVTVLIEGTVTL